MKELWKILGQIEESTTHEQSAALATVIATSGSTYRRPGARLLVTGSHSIGAVSAGCLEDEVISIAQRVLRSGQPQLMRFDTTEEMDAIAGTGLGCRGTIEVFIEPLPSDGSGTRVYRELRRALLEEQACILAIEVPTGRHMLLAEDEVRVDELQQRGLLEQLQRELGRRPAERATCLRRHGNCEFFIEKIEPPLKLFVFGAGYDAIPLVEFAKELGFRVVVIDHRPAYLTRGRFPKADQLVLAHPTELQEQLQLDARTFIAIMTHNYLHDLEILKYALQSEAPYIGQIGPRSRTQELLAEITREIGPLPDEKLAQLHAPIGLDLGAEAPEEIALSILSEILAVRNARAAGFLRDRQAPIHSHEARER